jgi:hypothetical protein
MTKETLIKLHNHFSELVKGKFRESDFSKNYGSGGRSLMGEMTPQRRELIISDAKIALEDLERKNPFLKPKEEAKKVEPKKENNSKPKEEAK